MKNIVVLTLVVILLVSNGNADTKIDINSYAILVGVSDYSKINELDDLPNVKNDLTRMESYFKKSGFETKTLLDSDATKDGILKAIHEVANSLEPSDRVIFYFLGHGVIKTIGIKDFGYIIPWDSDGQVHTYISMDTIKEYSKILDMALHQLFILDSCASGAISKKSLLDVSVRWKHLFERQSRLWMAASAYNQEARADGPDNLSFYTYYLLRALEKREADYNNDGHVTFNELAEYLPSHAIHDNLSPVYGYLSGHDTGGFVFFDNNMDSHQASIKSRPPLVAKGSSEVVYPKLWINIIPESSSVEINDGETEYEDGVSLAPGEYSLLISSEGYVTKEVNLEIGSSDKVVDVVLLSNKELERYRHFTNPHGNWFHDLSIRIEKKISSGVCTFKVIGVLALIFDQIDIYKNVIKGNYYNSIFPDLNPKELPSDIECTNAEAKRELFDIATNIGLISSTTSGDVILTKLANGWMINFSQNECTPLGSPWCKLFDSSISANVSRMGQNKIRVGNLEYTREQIY